MEYTPKQHESERDYKIRLCKNRDLYDLSWRDISALMLEYFGIDKSPDVYRKFWHPYSEGYEDGIKQGTPSDHLESIEEKTREFEIQKIQFQDQKREYRKLLRNEARFMKIKEDIEQSVSSLNEYQPYVYEDLSSDDINDKEGLVLLSDWHMGMEVDNTFNKFNKEIFNQRVRKVVEKTIEYGKKNNISTLHVANLGDMISGTLHVSTRVQSNEDLIEQITYVAEVLSNCLSEFAKHFKQVKYYNVIGNHARILPNKNDVGLKENFEYLIPWYLEARLKDFDNIDMVSDEDGMIMANIMGEEVVFVHGNFDRADSCVKNISQMTGNVPDYIFMGHIHHHVEKENGHTTVIVNGSLIGADDHTVQKRLYAKPSQKFIVFDKEEGLESTYHIKLNKIN